MLFPFPMVGCVSLLEGNCDFNHGCFRLNRVKDVIAVGLFRCLSTCGGLSHRCCFMLFFFLTLNDCCWKMTLRLFWGVNLFIAKQLVKYNAKLFWYCVSQRSKPRYPVASLLQISQDIYGSMTKSSVVCGFWLSRWAMVEMSTANGAWSCLGSRFVTWQQRTTNRCHPAKNGEIIHLPQNLEPTSECQLSNPFFPTCNKKVNPKG